MTDGIFLSRASWKHVMTSLEVFIFFNNFSYFGMTIINEHKPC